jgi:hypothetical protein
MTHSEDSIGADLIRGAKAIAAFLGVNEKRVYYLSDHKHWPIGRIGSTLVASRAALKEHYERLTRGTAEPPPPAQAFGRRRSLRRDRPRRQRAAPSGAANGR